MAINYELIAANRARREAWEEEKRRREASGGIDKILLGAATAYLTAGLAPALLGGAVALAPAAETVIPAVMGGIKGASAKTAEEAAVGGVETGITPTATKWTKDTARAMTEATRKAWEERPENKKYLPKTVTSGEAGMTYTYETATPGSTPEEIRLKAVEEGLTVVGIDSDTGALKYGKSSYQISDLSLAGRKVWAGAVKNPDAAIQHLADIETARGLTEKDKKILADRIPALKYDPLAQFFRGMQ